MTDPESAIRRRVAEYLSAELGFQVTPEALREVADELERDLDCYVQPGANAIAEHLAIRLRLVAREAVKP